MYYSHFVFLALQITSIFCLLHNFKLTDNCIIDGVTYFQCRDAAKYDIPHTKVSVRCEQCNYDIQCCNYTKYNATDPECGNHGRFCPENDVEKLG